ncbi:hypothetical protein MASR2M79_20800 [Aminivibrio sp.]
MADTVFDTSALSMGDIRKRLLSEFEPPSVSDPRLRPSADCDFVFDVRFLTNPFYIPDLSLGRTVGVAIRGRRLWGGCSRSKP